MKNVSYEQSYDDMLDAKYEAYWGNEDEDEELYEQHLEDKLQEQIDDKIKGSEDE